MTIARSSLLVIDGLSRDPDSPVSAAELTAVLQAMSAGVCETFRDDLVALGHERILALAEGGKLRSVKTKEEADALILDVLQGELTSLAEKALSLAEALKEIGCRTDQWEIDSIRQVAGQKIVSVLRSLAARYIDVDRDDLAGPIIDRLSAPAQRARGSRPQTDAGATAFLRTSLRNEYRSALRRRRREANEPPDMDTVPGDLQPDWPERDIADLMRWALDEVRDLAGTSTADLDDMLRIANGPLTVADVARRDGVTVDAVYQRHSRFRRRVFEGAFARFTEGRYSPDQMRALAEVLDDLRGRKRR